MRLGAPSNNYITYYFRQSVEVDVFEYTNTTSQVKAQFDGEWACGASSHRVQ